MKKYNNLISFIRSGLVVATCFANAGAGYSEQTITEGIQNAIAPPSSAYTYTLTINSPPIGSSAYCCSGYPCTGTSCASTLSYGDLQYVNVEPNGYYNIGYNVNLVQVESPYISYYEGGVNIQFNNSTTDGYAPTITGQTGGTASLGPIDTINTQAYPLYFVPGSPTVVTLVNQTGDYLSFSDSQQDPFSSCCSGSTDSCTNGSCSTVIAPGSTQYVNLSPNGFIQLQYAVCTSNASSCPTCSKLGSFGVQFASSSPSGTASLEATITYNYDGAANVNSSSGGYDVTFTTSNDPCPGGTTIGAVQTYSSIPYRGVNLAGSDFAEFYPPCACDAVYFASVGSSCLRLPVLWEYLQAATPLGTAIDFTTGDAAVYAGLVNTLTEAGFYVVIDMHNYMRYNIEAPGVDFTGPNYIIGNTSTEYINGPSQEQYAVAWQSIASQFASNPLVIFDLMNEPNNMSTDLILSNYNYIIPYIREAEATASVAPHLILLEGNGFSCLGSWVIPNSDYGTGNCTPNSEVFIPSNIVDSGNNYAINAHEYFTGGTSDCTTGNPSDCCGSGLTACIPSDSILVAENFTSFVSYLQSNSLKAFVSEIGGVGNVTGDFTQQEAENCAACIDNLLTGIDTYPYNGTYGFIGWTGWSGGSFQQTYNLDLNPNGYTGSSPNQVIQMTNGFNLHMTPP